MFRVVLPVKIALLILKIIRKNITINNSDMRVIVINGIKYMMYETGEDVSNCNSCHYYSECRGLCPIRAYSRNWAKYILKIM